MSKKTKITGTNFSKSVQDHNDIPTSGLINPYSYIDVNDYSMSRRGQANYQEDLAELQYLAELRQQEFMNDYNSPENQAELQRQAGLNPDLVGVGGDSSSAPGPSTSRNPVEGMKSNSEVASDIFGIISTVTSLTMGIATGGASLAGLVLGNTSKALGVAGNAYKLFSDFSAGDPAGMDGFVDNIPMLSSTQRKNIKRIYDQWSGSPYQEKAGMDFDTSFMKSQGDFYRHSVDPRYNSEDFDAFSKAWKPLIDALNDEAVQSALAGAQKGRYDQNYYDPSQAPDMFGADLGTKKENKRSLRNKNDLFDAIRKPLLEVLDNLDALGKVEDGNLSPEQEKTLEKFLGEDGYRKHVKAREGKKQSEQYIYGRAILSALIIRMFGSL